MSNNTDLLSKEELEAAHRRMAELSASQASQEGVQRAINKLQRTTKARDEQLADEVRTLASRIRSHARAKFEAERAQNIREMKQSMDRCHRVKSVNQAVSEMFEELVLPNVMRFQEPDDEYPREI